MRRRGVLAGASLLALLSGGALSRPTTIAEPAGASPRGEGPGAVGGSPTLDLNFVNGSPIDPRISFARASSATYFDATGTLQTAANDTPRIDYGPTPGAAPLGLLIEEARTNSIRNPRAEGAVIADGVERVTNGTFALDVINAAQDTQQNGWSWHLAGTTTVAWNGSAVVITPDGTNRGDIYTSITTVAGQTYIVTCDVAGVVLNLAVGTTALNNNVLAINTLIGAGQTFTFVATTTTTFIGFGRVGVGAATLDNVSVKSGGLLPTNWSSSNSNGLIPIIVGVGAESGIPYIDLQLAGTAGAGVTNILIEQPAIIAAVAAQNWTASAFTRLVGGTLTNVTATLIVQPFDTTPASLAGATTTITPSGSSLSSQRSVVNLPATPANTASIRSYVALTTTAGAVNITLRIGAPQLELGGFATSPILPSIGTPVSASRAADNATIPLGSWFNPAGGSIVARGIYDHIGTTNQGLLCIDDGTVNNRITLRNPPSLQMAALYQVASAQTAIANCSPLVLSALTKFGAALSSGGVSACINGGSVVSAAGAAPTGLTTMRLGQQSIGATFMNNHFQRVRYWPRILGNTELQAVTT